MPNAQHNATKIGIWTLILVLPLQCLVAGGSTCANDGIAFCGKDKDCCCRSDIQKRQQKTCCCHHSEKRTKSCCHQHKASQSKCECGIGCSCGHGQSSDMPAVPARDSQSRSDIAVLAMMPNAIASAIDLKCPQRPVHIQLEAVQAVSIDRCSTLCRYML